MNIITRVLYIKSFEINQKLFVEITIFIKKILRTFLNLFQISLNNLTIPIYQKTSIITYILNFSSK